MNVANMQRVSKSFVDAQALAEIIAREYGLRDVHCQLISATMRDVYLVVSRQKRHVFFLYQHAQRSANEISAEWQLIDYLSTQGVSVAPALLTTNGHYAVRIEAPEGVRFGVLATYVEGDFFRRRPSEAAAHAYGRTIARIHCATDALPNQLERPEINLKGQITQSLRAFQEIVDVSADDLAYLRECQAILLDKVHAFTPERLSYGYIHGDVIRTNALITDTGCLTVIDFDLCGPGWRVYDVASFLHTIRGLPEEQPFGQAFLAGYELERPVLESEQNAIPVCEAVRAIFSIGVPAMNIHHWGSAYFYAFLDGTLSRLRNTMERL